MKISKVNKSKKLEFNCIQTMGGRATALGVWGHLQGLWTTPRVETEEKCCPLPSPTPAAWLARPPSLPSGVAGKWCHRPGPSQQQPAQQPAASLVSRSFPSSRRRCSVLHTTAGLFRALRHPGCFLLLPVLVTHPGLLLQVQGPVRPLGGNELPPPRPALSWLPAI